MTIILSSLQYHYHRLHGESIAREQLATDYGTPLYEYSAESMHANTTGAETLFPEKILDDVLALYKFLIRPAPTISILNGVVYGVSFYTYVYLWTFLTGMYAIDVIPSAQMHLAHRAGADPEVCAFAAVGTSDAVIETGRARQKK